MTTVTAATTSRAHYVTTQSGKTLKDLHVASHRLSTLSEKGQIYRKCWNLMQLNERLSFFFFLQRM